MHLVPLPDSVAIPPSDHCPVQLAQQPGRTHRAVDGALAAEAGDEVRQPATPGAAAVLQAGAQAGRLTFMTYLAGREGQHANWPPWVPRDLVAALSVRGVAAPWRHQAEAADLAASGESVIISTGTASGKSLGYL
ncbi:MAG TPA: hypothetical protein VKB62_14850, partial [Streptosporangiaceae bacterium]|nr:hypothetical protein [Streptosporangiaceae bacterium]